MANTYLYEKMLATRQSETHHHMHLSRKPAHIEQSSTFVEYTTGKPGTLLVEPGSRHQQAGQRREATIS
ncbi:MAG TPA: hypothetical protein VKR06_40155 [Ktedonosporobacter sp.]|nr:hypothetical protein [Ktedonosporobacter sp.]